MTASPVPSFGMLLRRPGEFSAQLDAFNGLHSLGRSAIY